MTSTAPRRPGDAALRSTGVRLALGVFAACALANLGANLADAVSPGGAGADVANVSQFLLMPALALVVALAVRAPRPRLVRLTLLALGFSWLGDSLPDVVGPDAAFLAMMGAFLAAQVTYVAAFWPLRRRSLAARPWALVAYVAAFVALVATCAPGAGVLLGPVLVYGACLAAMAVLATGAGRLAGVGGALFLVSDALIALREFEVLDPPASGFWVMSTYLAAQALLAAGVVRAATPQGEAPAT